MSDALPLPPRPNLEQYRKLAKEFQAACKSGRENAVRDWAAGWVETLVRLRGVDVTPEVRHQIDSAAQRMAQRWRKFTKAGGRESRCALADAQLFIARGHGFGSWPKLAKHIEALERDNSVVSHFELAADAIVTGDAATLAKLLRENPELIRERSAREHRSTLLHYASANGVEDFRQKTPPNIVEITKLLLDAGADINAESDAYGGHSTALGLTATSWHPQAAGVQIRLMELLIERGAAIDGPDSGSAVNGCLQNGRGEAAEFLAGRGARLDLEGAAGVGRLEGVKSFFHPDGSLKPAATPEQLKDGFAWACEFGRAEVVDFLLRHGAAVDMRLKHNGQTGLHWAALGGHLETVNVLLGHGAPIDALDESFGGTPLRWALYGWVNAPQAAERGRYYEVVAALAGAGAKPDRDWQRWSDEDRRWFANEVNSDPRMVAALGGPIS